MMSKRTVQKTLHGIVRKQVHDTYITMAIFMSTEQIYAKVAYKSHYIFVTSPSRIGDWGILDYDDG